MTNLHTAPLQFTPKAPHEELAYRLAHTLDDVSGLPYYLYLTKTYPHPVLLRVLEVVMEVPDSDIRKSRGALFNWYIKRYGHQIDYEETPTTE